jgi:hypothetical protein
MSDVERLVAIEQIEQLHARRDRALDMHDWVALEAVHAPNHRSHAIGVAPVTTAAQSVANVRALAERIRFAHQSRTPEITFQSATEATGIWAMSTQAQWAGPESGWLVACGHYIETYERRSGEWLITSREERFVLTKQAEGSGPPLAADAVPFED